MNTVCSRSTWENIPLSYFYFCQKLLQSVHVGICYICLTFLRCGFSNVSPNCLLQMMHNRNGCICLIFLKSNGLPERMHSHIGCICLTSLHCVSSHVSAVNLDQRMHNHTVCICLAFLHCGFSNVSLNFLP